MLEELSGRDFNRSSFILGGLSRRIHISLRHIVTTDLLTVQIHNTSGLHCHSDIHQSELTHRIYGKLLVVVLSHASSNRERPRHGCRPSRSTADGIPIRRSCSTIHQIVPFSEHRSNRISRVEGVLLRGDTSGQRLRQQDSSISKLHIDTVGTPSRCASVLENQSVRGGFTTHGNGEGHPVDQIGTRLHNTTCSQILQLKGTIVGSSFQMELESECNLIVSANLNSNRHSGTLSLTKMVNSRDRENSSSVRLRENSLNGSSVRVEYQSLRKSRLNCETTVVLRVSSNLREGSTCISNKY